MVDLVLLFTAVCLPTYLLAYLPVCLPVSPPEGPFVHFDTLEAVGVAESVVFLSFDTLEVVVVAEFDVVGQLAETR